MENNTNMNNNASENNASIPEKKVSNVLKTSNDKPTILSLNVKVDDRNENEDKKHFFVKLPHSGYEFDVRGLTVEEEDQIKSSNTSTKRAADTIMKTLYNCISNDIKKPDHPFGRYDTFCKSISIADRDALAMGVIEQTYESTHDMSVRCNRCGGQFDQTVNLPECTTYTFYTGSAPILQKRHILEFPELKWKMYLKIPTLYDELKTLNTNEKNPDLQQASQYIYIDKLEYEDKLDTGQIINDAINNYVLIYGMIKKQPAIIRKRIEKEYEKFRSDFGMESKFETVCPNCGADITVNIVPISHFLYLVQ